jgi:hypothetical protein
MFSHAKVLRLAGAFLPLLAQLIEKNSEPKGTLSIK